MYDQAYQTIGKGLRLAFFGMVLANVAGLFSWFGLSMIGLVVTLVGLSSAGRGDSGYRTAFHIELASLAVAFVISLFAVLSPASFPLSEDAWDGITVVSNTIFMAISICYVCTTSAELLRDRAYPLSLRAESVWKFYGVSAAVAVVCILIAAIPVVVTAVVAIIVSFVSSLVLLLAGVFYMVFLYQASDVFLHWQHKNDS